MRALANAIDLPVKHIREIVRGSQAMTAGIASKLARYFETTPEFWLNLQAASIYVTRTTRRATRRLDWARQLGRELRLASLIADADTVVDPKRPSTIRNRTLLVMSASIQKRTLASSSSQRRPTAKLKSALERTAGAAIPLASEYAPNDIPSELLPRLYVCWPCGINSV